MPFYEVRFLKASTGRSNKARIYAYDEDELRHSIKARGNELVSFEVSPEPEATEPQLQYLRSLGVTFSGALTLQEASSLIDNAKSRQQPADAAMRSLLHSLKVEVNRFTSKREAYHRICAALAQRDPIELATWYVYRVYRNNFNRSAGPEITDWCNDRFRQIAEEIVADHKLLRSLIKAREESETGFRWFGTFHSPDGNTYYGDSRSTAVHKHVIATLRRTGLCPDKASTLQNRASYSSSSPAREERDRFTVPAGHSDAIQPGALDKKTGCVLPMLFVLSGIASAYWII